MEWKIGEIKQVDGEWYQCVEGDCCRNCDFYNKFKDDICFLINNCSLSHRSDKTSVIFKKLEKVGEPYEHYGKLYQCYKLPMETEIKLLPDNCHPIGKDNLVEIEIKQNKEDMEEKNMETSKLKPFNLEAAKAGKPVCTRDGRKARIICFDAKRKDKKSIIALVPSKDYPGFEDLITYPNNGNYYGGHENDGDLMMLPEKKEGWINIYKEGLLDTKVYNTKEEAFNKASLNDYVDTVKICWEE